MLRGEYGRGTEGGMGEEVLEKGREFPTVPPARLFTVRKVKEGEPLLLRSPPRPHHIPHPASHVPSVTRTALRPGTFFSAALRVVRMLRPRSTGKSGLALVGEEWDGETEISFNERADKFEISKAGWKT